MKLIKLDLLFIKKRRKELNIPLQEMAEAIGFKNASTYLKYENGDYQFKADHVPILSSKLNCGINDLYFFDRNVSKIETKSTA